MKEFSYGSRRLLCAENGGMKLRIAVAGASLVILAAVVIAVVGSFQKSQATHLRKAMQISEYGLIQALDKLQAEPGWRDGFEKTVYEEGWYKVEITQRDSAGTQVLTAVSDGHSGAATKRQICNLTLAVNGAESVWVQQSIRQE